MTKEDAEKMQAALKTVKSICMESDEGSGDCFHCPAYDVDEGGCYIDVGGWPPADWAWI